MSLRWRLTLLTAVIVAVASGLLGVVVYATAARIQLESVDRLLLSRVPALVLRAIQSNPDRLAGLESGALAVGRVEADGTVTVLRAAGGDDGPLPFPVLSGEQIRTAAREPITVAGDPSYRVSVRTPAASGRTLVLAVSLTETQADLDRLARGIALAVLATTAVGALSAWLLVRRAFRPMDEVIESARAVAAGQLDRRIRPGPPGTEVGDLTAALDAVIGSLTASLAQVRESERRLRAFVSDASHEIRTPLTVIRGYTELLRAQARDGLPLSPRALQRIESEGQRLDRLVTALLTLERQDVGGQAADVVDLAALVAETFADTEILDRGRPVDVRCDACTVLGDADAWRQVLANLVQNIARHTPPGSPVRVRLAATDDQVVLTVDDTGPGIPPERRQQVLDRFGRLRTGHDPSGGFGLGLSIAAAAVSAHGGRLTLADSPTGGLRVLVTAPRTPPAPAGGPAGGSP